MKKFRKMILVTVALTLGASILTTIIVPSTHAIGITPTISNNTTTATPSASPDKALQTCPQISDLEKNGLYWVSRDRKWKCFSESTSTAISTFVGAQWVGIKLGKVICLYQPQEQMGFTIAMEQVHSDLILEPNDNSGNWSALVIDRRLCKSTNVADCAFYLEQPPTVTDIYKELQYTGGTGSQDY